MDVVHDKVVFSLLKRTRVCDGAYMHECTLIRSGNSSLEYAKFYIENFDRTLWEESIEWLNGFPGHGLGCRKIF